MLIRRTSVFRAELTVMVQGPEESVPTQRSLCPSREVCAHFLPATHPGPWTQSCKVLDWSTV